MGMNQKILAGLVHLMAIMFVTMIVINALGGAGYKGIFSVYAKSCRLTDLINHLKLFITGIFNQSTGRVSDNYKSYITPAGFTFSIWSVIYIFLGAGAIYSNTPYCQPFVYRIK